MDSRDEYCTPYPVRVQMLVSAGVTHVTVKMQDALGPSNRHPAVPVSSTASSHRFSANGSATSVSLVLAHAVAGRELRNITAMCKLAGRQSRGMT